MIQTNSALIHDLQQWAAEQLGLKHDASPAEVRAALLRQVRQDEGIPPSSAKAAYHVLVAGSNLGPRDVPIDALYDLEIRLRQEVDSFAAAFFSLDVAERRRRWFELKERCRWLGSLNARLDYLKAAMDCDLGSTADAAGDVRRLAGHLAELFVARNPDRAVLRQDLLHEFKDDTLRWGQAAQTLQENHADLAELDPSLIRQLASPEEIRREQAEARRTMRAAAKASEASQPAEKGSSAWVGLLVVGIVSGLLRGASCENTPSRQLPSVPKIEAPAVNLDEILRKFKEIEKKGMPAADGGNAEPKPRFIFRDGKLVLEWEPKAQKPKKKEP